MNGFTCRPRRHSFTAAHPLVTCAACTPAPNHLAVQVQHDQVHAVTTGSRVVADGHVAALDEHHLDQRLGDVASNSRKGTAAKRARQRAEPLAPCRLKATIA